MSFTGIKPLRSSSNFQYQIPLVFDDSVSYIQTVARLGYKTNELVNAVTELQEAVTELQEETQDPAIVAPPSTATAAFYGQTGTSTTGSWINSATGIYLNRITSSCDDVHNYYLTESVDTAFGDNISSAATMQIPNAATSFPEIANLGSRVIKNMAMDVYAVLNGGGPSGYFELNITNNSIWVRFPNGTTPDIVYEEDFTYVIGGN